MASSKAGFHQKDGSLVVFDQLSEDDNLVMGPAENNLGGLEVDAENLAAELNSVQDFRLSGNSSDPTDISVNSNTVYLVPFKGNRIALWDGTSKWNVIEEETVRSIGSFSSSTMYDIFAYDNGGSVALEKLAWSGVNTRATAITLNEGVWVKSGDATRRYIGTVYSSNGANFVISDTRCDLFNVDNRIRHQLHAKDTTSSWTYGSSTWRQARGASGNKVEIVIGVLDQTINVRINVSTRNTGDHHQVSIGENSTTTPDADATIMDGWDTDDGINELTASLNAQPSNLGYNYYAWLERCHDPTATFHGEQIGGAGAVQRRSQIMADWWF